jgi:predicted DNA-binding transcriptional regulator AlpA
MSTTKTPPPHPQPRRTARTKTLGLNEVAEVLGVTRKTLVRWLKAGLFPQPAVRGYGPRGKMLWSTAQVEEVLAGKFPAGRTK